MSLTPVADGIWCLTSHFTVWGCTGSTRMTVVRTGGGLVLYSPVRLVPEVIDEIDRLGRVRSIVAPNLFHHLFIRDAIAAFPEARVFAPEGLAKKIGPLPRAEITSVASTPAVSGELDAFVFSGHRIRETLLFHVASGTLITADLLYNFQSDNFPAEKAFFRLVGCYGEPGVPFYHRFAIEHRASVSALIAWVRARDIRRIVMCHGRIIESPAGTDVFAASWARFS